MTKATIAGGLGAIALVGLVVAAGYHFGSRHGGLGLRPASAPAGQPAASSPPAPATALPAAATQGFLYGRVTTADGGTLEGRLRWGGTQETFWNDYFIGVKRENPWVGMVPPDQLPPEDEPFEIFGIQIGKREGRSNSFRRLMVPFGQLARIESQGRDVRVTLKSGSVYDLDRLESSDFDDGLRVWDRSRGVVDLEPLQIRTVELLPTPPLGAVPGRLHGTVRTRQGELTGFIGWNRDLQLTTDELRGRAAQGWVTVRFADVRSIVPENDGARSRITLRDGRELVLGETPEVGEGHAGVYVHDPRYGRTLVYWRVFERVDFSPAGSGPAYGDFAPGEELVGTVTTRDGRTLAGRLVYDLDETETTDTVDATSAASVSYTIAFDRIATIAPSLGDDGRVAGATLTLRNGETLRLEGTADVADGHGGVLVLGDGGSAVENVPWAAVAKLELAPAPAAVADTQ
jgi:hypothetical protein